MFYTIELPSMNPAQVKSMTLLLITNTTAAPDEVCGRGSLIDFSAAVKAKLDFTPTCVDDPVVSFLSLSIVVCKIYNVF